MEKGGREEKLGCCRIVLKQEVSLNSCPPISNSNKHGGDPMECGLESNKRASINQSGARIRLLVSPREVRTGSLGPAVRGVMVIQRPETPDLPHC